MVIIPKKAYLVKGCGLSRTSELNAFDNALLDAGVGNTSLVKCTSILPPDVEIVNEMREVVNGEILPSIYAKSCRFNDTEEEIEVIAGIGVALTDKMGLVAEIESKVNEDESSVMERLRGLLEEMASSRGLKIREIRMELKKCRVPSGSYGCAFVVVAMDV